MALKDTADFARFLSVGAVAGDAVRRDLTGLGHEPIELERYAMANKIWQTKIKRLRLPDLLCTACGVRIESRGKSSGLGVILSHSTVPGREWHAGGMRDLDLYAFVYVDAAGRTGDPLYLTRADLRKSEGLATRSVRKASSEGSEMTIKWPAWVPGGSGEIRGVDAEGRIVQRRDDGSTFRYSHGRKWGTQWLYVAEGEHVVGNEKLVAGAVPPPATLDCDRGWDPGGSLTSPDGDERYAAVKASGILLRLDLSDAVERVAERDEDWRIRLEAAVALARLQPGRWTRPVAATALDGDQPDDHRMESVFALSEIGTAEAVDALVAVAEPAGGGPPELRAAAVWGLGQGVAPRPDLVLRYLADPDDLVALHATAGMPEFACGVERELVRFFGRGERHAAAAARILGRANAVEVLLGVVHSGGTARLWALRALGDLPADDVRARGGDLLTAEIERDLEPFWIAERDWLRRTAATDLDALDVQRVRFAPH